MRETLVKLSVPQCNNPVDRDNPLGRYTIMTRICKQCGKEFEPCHPTSEFCSKSCATRYRNNEKMKDGSHNFYKLDRSKIAKDKVKKWNTSIFNWKYEQRCFREKSRWY